MSYIQAIILGLVQGLGEFLPISSSAHLILVPYVFGWTHHGDEFDIALHLGTLLAVVSYFWRDIITLVKAGLSNKKSTEKRLFWLVIIATIPAGLIGVLFEDVVDTKLRSAILVIAIALGLMGLVLVWADKISQKKKNISDLNTYEAIMVGFSQAVALLPGISRSGATMTTGLLFGFKREDAARFSFLMSIPIILGAGLLKLRNLQGSDLNGPFVVGVLVAAITGFLSIRWLLKYLNKSGYAIFAWYRIVLSLLIISLVLIRG